MTITRFSYPSLLGPVEIEAWVSRDGERGSISVPWGWYVDELRAWQNGRIVQLSDADEEAAEREAVRRVELGY